MGIREIPWAIPKIVEHEGFRLEPYTDTEGFITGGIGHKFTRYDFDNFSKKWSREKKMTYWQQRFEEDLDRAEATALSLIRQYEIEQTDAILYVLTDMAFILGARGLGKFRNFLNDLRRGDIEGAIQEMKYKSKGSEERSKWYRQVPRRVNSLIQILRSSNESNG